MGQPRDLKKGDRIVDEKGVKGTITDVRGKNKDPYLVIDMDNGRLTGIHTKDFSKAFTRLGPLDKLAEIE